MRKVLLKVITISVLLVLVLGISACGSKPDVSEGKTIKIACVATTEPMATSIKNAMEANGYKAEVVMFDGNNLPATALKDGSVDALFANHLPWINTFNSENNSELQMVQPYYYFSPFRIFSVKYKSLEEIPDGAKVIIPNDPANQDRSLRMLSEIEFIKLNEKSGSFYNMLDIAENTKNLEFTEMEIINTARSIRDVDFVFAMAFIAQSTGNIDPSTYLYEDPLSEDYPMGLVVNKDDVNADWAVNAMKAVKTEENMKIFNEEYEGVFTLIE